MLKRENGKHVFADHFDWAVLASLGRCVRLIVSALVLSVCWVEWLGSGLVFHWPVEQDPCQYQAAPVGDGADDFVHEVVVLHDRGS